MRRITINLLAAVLVLGLGACSNNQADSQESSAGQQSPPHPPMGSTAGQGSSSAATGHGQGELYIAGLHFEVPSEWQDLGPKGMRQAQYSLPPMADDEASAEVNVFYFGPSSGGGIDANITRWVGQMSLPDGGRAAEAAVRSKETIGGLEVHFVSVDGTYNESMGSMGGQSAPREGYRMVAAIVDGPQGNVFLKLTGPKETAGTMEQGLRSMISTVRTTEG
jgi:hypothetical protein